MIMRLHIALCCDVIATVNVTSVLHVHLIIIIHWALRYLQLCHSFLLGSHRLLPGGDLRCGHLVQAEIICI